MYIHVRQGEEKEEERIMMGGFKASLSYSQTITVQRARVRNFSLH